MADQEQTNRLLKSVKEWNTWREQHPTIEPDLRNADLNDTNLFFANLSRANLSKANLRSADLNDANLNDANLNDANLSKASLIRTNLSKADLSGANLSKANLNSANLNGANLNGAHLSKANLSKANLIGTSLSFTALKDADLSGAHLNSANLSLAHFNGADLSGAYIGETSFGDRDFRMIKGLETIVHEGPSPLSINSLYLSNGDIPEQFLRGTGAQDTFIEYVKSLTSRPIEYYTCFISYSSNDQVFAKRLYNDLQGNGVRCWYAPEDLKTGDFFWKRIDESIRVYDKLLVILSSHSVESDWVEREVMAALEKEGYQKRHVLFPLHLDDAVKTTCTPWAADMRRRRHMTDFTGWGTDYTVYQRGLERLLRDLKAESAK